MNAKGADILYIFGDSLRSLRQSLSTTVLTSATIGFSLAIFSIFGFVFVNLNSVVASLGDRTQIIAYIKDGDTSAPESLRRTVQNIPGVKSAEYVSKENALRELKEALKGHAGVLEGVDTNPLPASLEIKLWERSGPVEADAVAGRLKSLPWVEEVQMSREWVEKFSSFLKLIELAAVFLGIFLALATIFIISNTVRLSVYARKDEIEIMKLVGASDLYVKTPFFIEGVAQGLAGGLIALGILAAGRALIVSKIPSYFAFVADNPFGLVPLAGMLVAAGVLFGVAGSLISMGRFLKV